VLWAYMYSCVCVKNVLPVLPENLYIHLSHLYSNISYICIKFIYKVSLATFYCFCTLPYFI
jgi:hypothetical protein